MFGNLNSGQLEFGHIASIDIWETTSFMLNSAICRATGFTLWNVFTWALRKSSVKFQANYTSFKGFFRVASCVCSLTIRSRAATQVVHLKGNGQQNLHEIRTFRNSVQGPLHLICNFRVSPVLWCRSIHTYIPLSNDARNVSLSFFSSFHSFSSFMLILFTLPCVPFTWPSTVLRCDTPLAICGFYAV